MVEGEGSLRVPTRTVRVEAAFPGEAPRAVELFTPAGQPGQALRACVAELLERDQRFLPARDEASGGVVALGSRSLSWIALPLVRSGEPLEDGELFDHRRDVRVELADGTAFEGELLYSAPAGSTRVVDVLNSPSRFLALWLADRVVFLNKSFVRLAAEIPHPDRSSSVAPPPPAQRKPGPESAGTARARAKRSR